MRILITGGAGFLGSHLSDRLLGDGHEVVCLDNFFTGRKSNIQHLLNNPKFELIRHDVIDPFKVETDQIYNLACPASPPHYQFNPIKTTKTSVMGAINCLGLAKRTKARVFQASTSEVYGDPNIHPQVESYWGNVNPIGRRSCYDEGKRCAETLIYGDGSQTRSFCYVDDLVDGFVRFMNQTTTVGPLNLGNPGEFTMLELAQIILKQVGGSAKITHCPLPADDPKQRRPDITLAKKHLGWEPKVPLEEGIKRTIAYFRKELGV